MLINKKYKGKIQKITPDGNLFVLIPKEIEAEIRMKQGQEVEIDVNKRGEIVLKKARRRT